MINIEEIKKFDLLAKDWLNSKGPMRALHQINPIRLFYIKEKIISHFNLDIDPAASLDNQIKKIKILDVGCGSGLASAALARLGMQVVGIDASLANINNAKEYAQLHKLNNLEYFHINSEEQEELPISYNYDVLLCLEVVEHVDDIAKFINHYARYLSPKGAIFISTINRNIKSYLGAIVAAEYILGWVPYKTHSFKKFVKPYELDKYLGESNFQIKNMKGINFHPCKKWHLSDDISINYISYSTSMESSVDH